jgi:hypothetical protein
MTGQSVEEVGSIESDDKIYTDEEIENILILEPERV